MLLFIVAPEMPEPRVRRHFTPWRALWRI